MFRSGFASLLYIDYVARVNGKQLRALLNKIIDTTQLYIIISQ
jgi:hypothetical protein